MTDRVVIQFSTSASKPFFWTGWKNRYSFAIRWMGHSPFSHMDFVLDDGNLLGASDQGAASPCIGGNPRGVAIRPPDYQLFGLRRQMIIKTDKADDILSFLRKQLGKPFDNSGLHGFLSPAMPGPDSRDWRNPDKWWCSELGICAFEEGGYWWPLNQLPWPKTRVSPTDILMIFLLDPNWINRDAFWDPIPNLKMDRYEV